MSPEPASRFATTGLSNACTASTCDRPTTPGSKGTPSSGAPRPPEIADPLQKGLKPGEGELCVVALNQNRRGNGIHVWNSAGHVIERNSIRDTRDGIYFSFVSRSEVRDNDIERVRYGLHYMYSDGNRFESNVFRDNAAGAALMFSKGLTLVHNRFVANRSHRAYGLLLQTVEDTLISNNEISGNTLGLFMESGHGNQVLGNRIASNHVGVRISDSSDDNVFSGNRFTGNIHPARDERRPTARTAGRGTGAATNGRARPALDLDGNGIADLPHRELDVFGELRRPVPGHRPDRRKPGERLLRYVYGRVALPGCARNSSTLAPIVTGGSR